MATYSATFGFPHGEKKKPVLIPGPNKSREEQRAEFQKAAMSKTNPKYGEIHLVSSSRGAVKKKRFEKGPWKNREDAVTAVESTVIDPPGTSEIPNENGVSSSPETPPNGTAASPEGPGSNDSEDIPDQSGAGDEESE